MRDSFSVSEISSHPPKSIAYRYSNSLNAQTSFRFTRIYFKSRCTRFPRVSDYTIVPCSIFVIACDFITTFTTRRERINAAPMCKIQVTENRLSRHPRADPTEGTSCTGAEGRNRCFQFFSFIRNFLYPPALAQSSTKRIYPRLVFSNDPRNPIRHLYGSSRCIDLYYTEKSIFAKKYTLLS